MKLKDLWGLIKDTIKDWSEDKAPRLAASLAYYTVFSLAPLLVLVISITGFVVGNNDTIRSQILSQVQGLVGPQTAGAVDQLISQTSQAKSGVIATVIGLVTLLFGATALFGQLQDALNTIWEVKPRPDRGFMGLIKDRFLSFTMVLGMCFLLLVSLVISAGLSIVDGYFRGVFGDVSILAQALNFVISIGAITFIFATIFKVLPDVEIQWKDVWIGGLVTALLFSIGKYALGAYLGNNATTSAYGAAGSLVILLLWVYYSAQILFLGAEFTQVYSRKFGSRIIPSPNAVPVTDEERAQQGLTEGRKREPDRYPNQGMIPVAGQPVFHDPEAIPAGAPRRLGTGREKVNYQPPNPASVVPVIALGTIAAAVTTQRVVRMLLSLR
jgi:membrane protein